MKLRKQQLKNEDFIKISLVVRDEEIKAENDIADQKTKKIIKDIVNPIAGLFVNDTFDANKDLNTNIQKNMDNPYVLKPEVQKQLNDTVLKKLIPLPVLDPLIHKPDQDIFDPPVSSVQPSLPKPSIPNEVPYIPPIPEPLVPPSLPDPGELPPLYEEPPPPL